MARQMAALFAAAWPLVGWTYDAKVNYQLNCMGCHLPDGSGQRDRVPSVRQSLLLFSTISEGREFVIRVPGVAQSALTNEETAALLNWMARNLSDQPLPVGFVDYTAEEVRASRSKPLVQVARLRGELVARTLLAAAPTSHDP
jgi:hypothetical protein